MPQWSPVMKTGNTRGDVRGRLRHGQASMEPGHEDREYPDGADTIGQLLLASMEPGHEDREYEMLACRMYRVEMPQWSPVMKTGNTSRVNFLPSASNGLNGARS